MRAARRTRRGPLYRPAARKRRAAQLNSQRGRAACGPTAACVAHADEPPPPPPPQVRTGHYTPIPTGFSPLKRPLYDYVRYGVINLDKPANPSSHEVCFSREGGAAALASHAAPRRLSRGFAACCASKRRATAEPWTPRRACSSAACLCNCPSADSSTGDGLAYRMHRACNAPGQGAAGAALRCALGALHARAYTLALQGAGKEYVCICRLHSAPEGGLPKVARAIETLTGALFQVCART